MSSKFICVEEKRAYAESSFLLLKILSYSLTCILWETSLAGNTCSALQYEYFCSLKPAYSKKAWKTLGEIYAV